MVFRTRSLTLIILEEVNIVLRTPCRNGVLQVNSIVTGPIQGVTFKVERLFVNGTKAMVEMVCPEIDTRMTTPALSVELQDETNVSEHVFNRIRTITPRGKYPP